MIRSQSMPGKTPYLVVAEFIVESASARGVNRKLIRCGVIDHIGDAASGENLLRVMIHPMKRTPKRLRRNNPDHLWPAGREKAGSLPSPTRDGKPRAAGHSN